MTIADTNAPLHCTIPHNVKIIVGDHMFAIYHDSFDKEDLLKKSINRAFSRLDIKLVIANPSYLLFYL